MSPEYETAARAEELLSLNVEDLDPEFRRARVTSKGGAIEYVHWQTGTARLLTHLAAAGWSAAALQAKSRHAHLGSLGHYVRLGEETSTRITADHDPTARHRPR